jgi:multicomponent Na+:H+ antiporter subunit D
MTPAALASLLPVPVVILITGAVLAPLAARWSKRAPLAISLLATVAATVILALFARRVYSGQVIVTYLGHQGPAQGSVLGVTFAADAFGLSFALLTTVIGGLLLLSTLSELSGLGRRELGGYACLFQLLLAALVGSALTADSLDLFVWFEVAALSSYGLTGFFLERPLALEAAFKIMVLTNIAAFWVFVGTALLYADHGGFNFGQLHNGLGTSVKTADLLALGLIVSGFATKAGLVPFHGWLADAHTAAPGQVSALFSGLMVNLGIVGIARYALQIAPATHRPLLGLITVLGCVSAVTGAVLALAQDDLKRLLAYDTVSQLGVLAVGIGSGTSSGTAGMIYHLISHALFKSLLFLCAGAVVHATGLTRLSQMGGLARHRPVTTIAFLIGVAAIAGVPPLDGFVSIGLIHDGIKSNEPVVYAVMLLAQVVTVAALARATYLAFFRRRDDDYDRLERPHPGMTTALSALAVGSLVFGCVPTWVLHHVVAPATGALRNAHGYSSALLAGGGRLPAPPVTFHYFSASEWITSVATVIAGLLVARWYVRRATEPALVRGLRALHTGSVNDYALYATAGLIVTTLVLVVRI